MSALLDDLIETERKYRETMNGQGEKAEVEMANRRIRLMYDMKRFSNGADRTFSETEGDELKRDIEELAAREWCANEASALVTRHMKNPL